MDEVLDRIPQAPHRGNLGIAPSTRSGKMSLFETLVTEGNEKADEFAKKKHGAML